MAKRVATLAAMALLLLAGRAFCAEPTTRAAQPDTKTPKGALMAWSRSLPEGGIDKALSAYHAENPAERVAARAMAEENLACATLQNLVEQKWGKDAGSKILHALSDETDDDLLAADEKKDGDKVIITFKDRGGDQTPLTLVQVDGQWKVSVAAFLKDAGGTGLELARFCRQVTTQIENSTREFKTGDYSDIDALSDVVAKRIKQAMESDDSKPDAPAPV